MKQPPHLQLPFNLGSLIHATGQGPSWMLYLVILIGIVFLVSQVIRVGLGFIKMGLLGILIAGFVLAFFKLKDTVSKWQTSALSAKPHAVGGIPSGLLPPGTAVPSSSFNPQSSNPLLHQSPSLIAIAIIVAIVWGLGYLIYRSMSPKARATLQASWRAWFATDAKSRKTDQGEYELVGVEVATRKDNGKVVTIDAKDRFINTMILGSIGTGKSSRVMTKGAYQDIRNIARGVPMDVMVMDPDGSMADSALKIADKFGIETLIIDLRGSRGRKSTVSFNPFAGGDISDIIDNVRAVLKEQMGNQDSFFQNAQDDLVRTVIQVQVPLWPDTDFIKFAELITDPVHFRAICITIFKHLNNIPEIEDKKRKRGKDDDDYDDIEQEWKWEVPYIQARLNDLEPHIKSMILSAARAFLNDTRSEQKLEHLEKITKGLKIVVNELSSNPKMREALGKSELPSLDYRSFFSATKEPGRLIVVVTTNRPVGDLFGKLFLVSLKMHALQRDGNEFTRRPVYTWIDEFPRYATDSLKDLFSQGRKYRVATTLAFQERGQLKLKSNLNFINVVEGSCRNKIYFPSPSPEDAKYLETTLGTVISVQQTKQENRLGMFFLDPRRLDRRVSSKEQVDPRFRIEDIMYALTKDEAIFQMTVDNQAQVPFVGYTSYADVWVSKQKGFFNVRTQHKTKGRPWRKNKATSVATLTAPPNTNMNSATELSSGTEAQPVLDYVKAGVNPNEVLSLSTLKAAKHESIESELKPQFQTMVPAQTEDTLQAKMFDFNIGEKTQTDNVSGGKVCPQCGADHLQLTEDQRKWKCPSCEFERKNRSSAQ